MLFAINVGIHKITEIPHEKLYRTIKLRLDPDEFKAIEDELNKKISGKEVNTSTFLPGHNWFSTVYEPIYTKACRGNREVSAKFFGIVLWTILMKRKDCWAFERYKIGNRDIKGMTYFRINLDKDSLNKKMNWNYLGKE